MAKSTFAERNSYLYVDYLTVIYLHVLPGRRRVIRLKHLQSMV